MDTQARRATRIKICGITRLADVQAACELGVDAIGLVFYSSSPRAVSIGQARALAREAGPFVSIVGLFVNPEPEDVDAVLQQVPLHVLQFHGEETPGFCQQFNRPWIKALRMKPDINLQQYATEYGNAAAILLDTYKPGLQGGTGESFDWNRVPADLGMPLVLAGGLNPENVGDAIKQVNPYAVDVSGGVEISPGIKDIIRMKNFVTAVRQ